MLILVRVAFRIKWMLILVCVAFRIKWNWIKWMLILVRVAFRIKWMRIGSSREMHSEATRVALSHNRSLAWRTPPRDLERERYAERCRPGRRC
jgi:hypothetical protein